MYAKSEVTEIEEELAAASQGEGRQTRRCEVGDLLFDALLLARIVERDFPGALLKNMLAGAGQK